MPDSFTHAFCRMFTFDFRWTTPNMDSMATKVPRGGFLAGWQGGWLSTSGRCCPQWGEMPADARVSYFIGGLLVASISFTYLPTLSLRSQGGGVDAMLWLTPPPQAVSDFTAITRTVLRKNIVPWERIGNWWELHSDADRFFHVHMTDFTFYAFTVCYEPRMPQCFPTGLHSFQIELICNSWPLNWWLRLRHISPSKMPMPYIYIYLYMWYMCV